MREPMPLSIRCLQLLGGDAKFVAYSCWVETLTLSATRRPRQKPEKKNVQYWIKTQTVTPRLQHPQNANHGTSR
jgi:hypothetical protein